MKSTYFLPKASVLLCSLAVLAISSQAQAIGFKVSGQINRAVMYIDDGTNSDINHVDNINSDTRIRFVGSQDLGNGLSVGTVWESQFISNASSSVGINQNDDGASSFTERKLELYFDGAFGRVWLGQGDGAANGTSEVDLSGTGVAAYSGNTDWGGGVTFLDSAGANVVKVGSTLNSFDGLSRNDRIRYDTPKLGPVKLSVSATNGNAYEFGGTFASQFDMGKVVAAVGYVDTQDRVANPFSQWDGSISFLHNSGFNVTFSAGSRDPDTGPTADNYFVKVGYKTGKHAISADYGETSDLAALGDTASAWTGAYVYNLYKGVQIYGAVRVFSLDRTSGLPVEDVTAALFGARIKFM